MTVKVHAPSRSHRSHLQALLPSGGDGGDGDGDESRRGWMTVMRPIPHRPATTTTIRARDGAAPPIAVEVTGRRKI